jgi:hypothetical protein
MKKWFCILGIAITLIGVLGLAACGSSSTTASTTSTTQAVTTTSSTAQTTASQTTAAATTTKATSMITLPTGTSPNLTLANQEVDAVREASYKYMGSHSGRFPANSDALVGTYLASKPDGSYTFNTNSGSITAATSGTNITKGFTWNDTTDYWK